MSWGFQFTYLLVIGFRLKVITIFAIQWYQRYQKFCFIPYFTPFSSFYEVATFVSVFCYFLCWSEWFISNSKTFYYTVVSRCSTSIITFSSIFLNSSQILVLSTFYYHYYHHYQPMSSGFPFTYLPMISFKLEVIRGIEDFVLFSILYSFTFSTKLQHLFLFYTIFCVDLSGLSLILSLSVTLLYRDVPHPSFTFIFLNCW